MGGGVQGGGHDQKWQKFSKFLSILIKKCQKNVKKIEFLAILEK